MPKSKLLLLSREHMETQISQVDLLLAMYPSENEIVIDDATSRLLGVLRDWSTSHAYSKCEAVVSVPPMLSFDLNLNIDSDIGADSTGMDGRQVVSTIRLIIDVPVMAEAQVDTEAGPDVPPPSLIVHLRQPCWMNRTQTSQLNKSIPPNCSADLLATIDYFHDEAAKHLSTHRSAADTLFHEVQQSRTQPATTESLVRTWFYFPSLSTRSKRTDLVTYAPHYNLTGFVLAGKPGILCLEGETRKIDEYMRFIKTESWGDIPGYQKKVSERYREVLGVKSGDGKGRVFENMQEVTDLEFMGEKRGERGNRADMRALEGWLDGKGLKAVFEKVLF